jgi:hypothetical protein
MKKYWDKTYAPTVIAQVVKSANTVSFVFLFVIYTAAVCLVTSQIRSHDAYVKEQRRLKDIENTREVA